MQQNISSTVSNSNNKSDITADSIKSITNQTWMIGREPQHSQEERGPDNNCGFPTLLQYLCGMQCHESKQDLYISNCFDENHTHRSRLKPPNRISHFPFMILLWPRFILSTPRLWGKMGTCECTRYSVRCIVDAGQRRASGEDGACLLVHITFKIYRCGA